MGDGTGAGRREDMGGAARETWRVRIRSLRSQVIIGSGVLLGGDTVLTCAHVLPDGYSPVRVELPEIDGAAGSTATPIEGCWIPGAEPGIGDVALLRLDRPRGPEHSARLLQALPLPGTEVEMYGYADSLYDGRGAALPARLSRVSGERAQLNPHPHLPRLGFSGGPVLDLERPSRVLGITVTAYRDDEDGQPLRLAHMILIDTVLKYLPQVRPWVDPAPGVDPSLASRASVRHSADDGIDIDYAEQLARWLRNSDSRPVYVTGVWRGSARHRTLQRALALADRELSAEAPAVLSGDPPETVPPVGSLDLALNVDGSTPDQVLGRIAQRLNLPRTGPDEVLRRLRTDHAPLTLALVGADGAAHREELLERCGDLAEYGCRLLIVLHDRGTVRRDELGAALMLRHRIGALLARLTALDEQLPDLVAAAPRLKGVEPPDEPVAKLWESLAGIQLARGNPAHSREEVRKALDRLDRRTSRVSDTVEAVRQQVRQLYARRAELRSRLEAARVLAVQHLGVEHTGLPGAEEVQLPPLFRTAHDALYCGRFDQEAAGPAVIRYESAVHGALGGAPEGKEI